MSGEPYLKPLTDAWLAADNAVQEMKQAAWEKKAFLDDPPDNEVVPSDDQDEPS